LPRDSAISLPLTPALSQRKKESVGNALRGVPGEIQDVTEHSSSLITTNEDRFFRDLREDKEGDSKERSTGSSSLVPRLPKRLNREEEPVLLF
jgi:hypothetical protein